MSIVKVEIKLPEAHQAILAFAENRVVALESLASMLRSTVSDVINGLLNAEIDLFLGAPDAAALRRLGEHIGSPTNCGEEPKEFKRRTKAMEMVGEMTLSKVLAFTALRIELAWQRRAVDTYQTRHLVPRLARDAEVLLDGPEELQ